MTSQHGVPRRLSSRPVADTPVDALLARADDLAKGWLLAMLEQRELEDAPAILAGDVVRDGPRLCDAVVRALADDHDLRRLDQGGALERLASRAGELAGTSKAEPSVRAVDALRGVIWAALREELVRPDADLVEALAERLALITELVRAAVLRRFAASDAGGTGLSPGAVTGVRGLAEASENREPGSAGMTDVDPDPVDDGPGVSAGDGETIGERAGVDPSSGGGEVADFALSRASSPRSSASRLSTPRAPGEGAIPVTADLLWRGALEDEVARAKRSGAKLALLLAELGDADRLSAVESAYIASETFGRFAQAVRSALRREDILACETESRAWIIARTTGRTGARALGSRIAAAVQDAEPWRGGPLTVGVGLAILGEDAHDAVGLIEAADEWTFAAESAGVATGERPNHSGGGGDPVDTGPRLVG